jgi:transposase
VWKTHNLKPFQVRTFKLSRDPAFAEKLVDVVGLYLNPPDHALVLCCDEKSQIQALDRTQPGLPIKQGRCGTMTHDYPRHGTTTLFAALELAEGKLIGTCMPRHRHQEWIKFLKLIDEHTPPDLDLHLIVDNYNTHKHPKVQAWLKRHPRFHIHFIPTSSSWLNLVERWFRDITDKRIRRGAFKSVRQLIDAIMAYIEQHNDAPTPFVWTAKAEDILVKVARAWEVFNVASE